MSFDDVYRKYYNELRRFGRQLNLSAEMCEDFAQETFMKYYIELNRKVIFKNPRAWLYKVYLNQFKTFCNSQKNESGSPERRMRVNDQSTDMLEEYTKNEKQRIVFGMLEKLTEKEKTILLLYNNGLSYSEMAEILEINPHSIGTTIVRAIERLKDTLKNHYYEMFEQD